MANLFHKQKNHNRNGKGQEIIAQWFLLLKQIFNSSNHQSQTRCAPHIRANICVESILNKFIIATIPCWLIGLWNLGYQINQSMTKLSLIVLPGWQGGLFSAVAIGHDSANIFVCFLLGLLYFLPIFIVALFTASIWEVIFSSMRRRPFSEGVLAFAWLFTLLMPAGIDLYKVFLGVSFGYVIGSAIFGGYGRYLVSPVLLSVVFLLFSYPELVNNPENWVPVIGADVKLAINLASTGGIAAIQSAGYSWWDLFIGIKPGPIGSVSVLGCILAGIYLVLTDSASWRIILGAVIGLLVTVLIYSNLTFEANAMSAISTSWHLVLGAFVFSVVFFATDPVTSASTPGGRWIFGILIGILTTVIRVNNPTYNEGVLFAVLLASLFSPVIDFCFVELNIRRRRNRRKNRHKNGGHEKELKETQSE